MNPGTSADGEYSSHATGDAAVHGHRSPGRTGRGHGSNRSSSKNENKNKDDTTVYVDYKIGCMEDGDKMCMYHLYVTSDNWVYYAFFLLLIVVCAQVGVIAFFYFQWQNAEEQKLALGTAVPVNGEMGRAGEGNSNSSIHQSPVLGHTRAGPVGGDRDRDFVMSEINLVFDDAEAQS